MDHPAGLCYSLSLARTCRWTVDSWPLLLKPGHCHLAHLPHFSWLSHPISPAQPNQFHISTAEILAKNPLSLDLLQIKSAWGSN